MANEFESALKKARKDLAQIEVEQKKLAQRKAQLLQTISALAPLVAEDVSTGAQTLADAIRTAIATKAMNNPATVFTPKIVRDMLNDAGFQLDKFKNHMASIHTVIARMQKAGELVPAGDTQFGGGYRWSNNSLNRFFYGAEV